MKTIKKYYRFTKKIIRKQNFKKLIFNPSESPLKKALSIALGVFIGVLPIWGVQIASAVVSAQFLKLNKPLAILGSHINITPLFPFIVFFSLKIGFALTGNINSVPALNEISLNSAKSYFWMFLIGSIPIAVLTSIVFGTLTYSAAKLVKTTNK